MDVVVRALLMLCYPSPDVLLLFFLKTAMPRVSSRWMAAPLLLTANFLRADILMSI